MTPPKKVSRGQILHRRDTYLLAFFPANPTNLVHALSAHWDEGERVLGTHTQANGKASAGRNTSKGGQRKKMTKAQEAVAT